MRPSSAALAALAVVLAAACGPRSIDCGHPDLVYRDGLCVCPPDTHYVCDETSTVCACEPLAPSDAGVPPDAPSDAGCTAPGEMMCGTACVDTRTSAAHCGACDTPCASPNRCVDARCVDPVIDVDVAARHVCALRASGEVWCWGLNAGGQLGDGTTIARHRPIRVEGIDDAVQLSLGGLDILGHGYGSTCVRHATGRVSCWGYVARADELSSASPVAVAISGIADAVDISVGDQHACAVRATGTVACWGLNDHGQLGNGMTGSWEAPPVTVSMITNARTVSAGMVHSCAVLADGTVACWGEGSNGELGQGRLSDSLVPVAVKGVVNAARAHAGFTCSCADNLSGYIQCWGSNAMSCLGREDDRASTPVYVMGGSDFEWMSPNDLLHSCARRATGSVLCWGADEDAPPRDGGVRGYRTPIARDEWTGALDVAPTASFTCGILADGRVACEGSNGSGQLGDGTTEPHDAPLPVDGLP